MRVEQFGLQAAEGAFTRSDFFAELDVKLDGSKPVLVSKHELPFQVVQVFRRTHTGSVFGRRQHA
jgi:hypothetical protein